MLALSALLLFPSLAWAGGSSPGSGWAILLASAPEREEAEARLRAMHAARAFAFVKPAEGFPRVLESSSLPGLQPGLYVVEKGEADDSQLDYDYTSCQGFEASFERALGGFGNPVFIVSSTEPGPHSAVRPVLRIVGVGCGGLRVSEPFVGADAVFHLGRWAAVPELTVRPAPAKSPGGKRFSLLNTEAAGADAGSGEWFADVEWVEARCAWELDDGQ
jgi:hypothetical protein